MAASSSYPPMDKLYQKVVWKENGKNVTRIIPVVWVRKSGAGTYVAWPNKVNAERDIVNRTKPTKYWSFFPLKKRKEFYGKLSTCRNTQTC